MHRKQGYGCDGAGSLFLYQSMTIGVLARLMTSDRSKANAGISRYATRLIEQWALSAEQHRFHLFVRPDFEVPAAWRRPHMTFHPVYKPIKGYGFLVEGLLLPMLERRLGLDAWFGTAPFLPARSRIANVCMIHDLTPIVLPEFFDKDVNWREQKLLHRAARVADCLVANSVSTRDDIVHYLSYPSENVIVTQLGPGNLPVGSGDRPTTAFGRYLFTLGTLEPRKNLARLVDAFARVAAEPEFRDVGLLIAGGKGWGETDLGARLNSPELSGRVQLLGYVPDEALPGIFGHATAFVYVSLYEGFGLPILEAMLMNCPVVASDHPAHIEVAGEFMERCQATEVDSIAEALRQALRRPRDSKRLAAAQARAQTFTWGRCAELTLGAIEQAVAARGSGRSDKSN